MIFKKLLFIKNCGKFVNFIPQSQLWNGCFEKINTIYAPNGSGKTTLSIIFKSLNNEEDLLIKKKSFNSLDPLIVKFIADTSPVVFDGTKWNKYCDNIKVFNSLYLEDNLYTISLESNKDLELLFGENDIQIKNKKNSVSQLTKQLDKQRNKVRNKKHYLKEKGMDYKSDKGYLEISNARDELMQRISILKDEIIQLYQGGLENYKNIINSYLSFFSYNLKISEIKLIPHGKENYQLIYGLQLDNFNFTIEERNKLSLKYVLSDGDKNALGLSFFLAKIDLSKSPENIVAVIDDPFTSFDTHRKMTTITRLSLLSSKVGQLILLSHDLNFINDFNKACSGKTILNLRINNLTNCIEQYDLEIEMLTGLAKDLHILRTYKQEGNINQTELREVVRCIRPSLEGMFRMKYNSYIQPNMWLGDFIKLIRNSDKNSSLYRLKEYINELSEINDYSKIYHHSKPEEYEMIINPAELLIYVRRTLKLLEVI